MTYNDINKLNDLSINKLKLLILKFKLINIKNNKHLWVVMVFLINMWYPMYMLLIGNFANCNTSVLFILLVSFLIEIFIIKEIIQPDLDDNSIVIHNKINEIKNLIKQKNQG